MRNKRYSFYLKQAGCSGFDRDCNSIFGCFLLLVFTTHNDYFSPQNDQKLKPLMPWLQVWISSIVGCTKYLKNHSRGFKTVGCHSLRTTFSNTLSLKLALREYSNNFDYVALHGDCVFLNNYPSKTK